VDQPSATTPQAATPVTGGAKARDQSQPLEQGGPAAQPTGQTGAQPGFAARGRARRRARFLRKARELAYRDLGGLVFNLHRFGQRNDALVLAKLNTLTHIDAELRTLESALSERQPVTVLREAGITACPRCAAIHSSEDRFCPNCGLPGSRHVDLPIAGQQTPAPIAGQPTPTQPAAQPQPTPTAGQPAATSAAGRPAGASGVGVPGAAAPAPPRRARRAPPPPAPAPSPGQATPSGEDEQPTEIIRAPGVGK